MAQKIAPPQQQKKPKQFGNFCWCFHSADWKREEILDHSFSLINVNDYVNKSLTMRIKYLWIYFIVFKTVLVYMSDLYLLFQSYGKKSDDYQIDGHCKDNLKYDRFKKWGDFTFLCDIGNNSFISFLTEHMFWLLLFSIGVTYLLSYLELKKAQKIIKSQDISFAFTNLVAYRYYCIRSYAYYCFFQLINDHKKRSDDIAFFVFFTFKGWKRFVFADTLRRILNIIILLNNLTSLIIRSTKNQPIFSSDDTGTIFAVITSSFILISWLMTGISLLIAFIVYIPLLTVIQGNLKEYCCHKIDKRIGEIINSKTQQKIKKIQKVEQAKREAAKKLGVNPNQLHLDESAIKKGFDIEILPDPTLPQIDVDLNDVGTGNYNNNGYYHQPYNTNPTYNSPYAAPYNAPYNHQYNGQYGHMNRGQPPQPHYQGSTVAYSDYSDSLNRGYDNGSSDSGSRNGSLPYQSSHGRAIQTTQPSTAQYMSSPYQNHTPLPTTTAPYMNSPYQGSTTTGAQAWNSPPKMPVRNQGWNDQMSNGSSSTYSNGSKPVYRRNGGNRPPFDTVSTHSEDPLIPTPPRSNNPRVTYRK